MVEGDDDYGLLIGRGARRSTRCSCSATRRPSAGIRERKRVVVDAAGYRERRRETSRPAPTALPNRRSARERSIELDPMSAQERRVVHEHLKDRAGVETYSEGDEPDRCVVVAPLVSG